MKLLPLGGKYGKDMFAKVDDEDFDFVNRWTWQLKPNGYITRIGKERVNGKRRSVTFLLHRVVMGEPKGKEVDHIHGDLLDVRKSQLGICTSNQNHVNKGKTLSFKTVSKYLGVAYRKDRRCWVGFVIRNGKTYRTPHFKEEHYAALARDLLALAVKGEYARTNFKIVCYKV